MSWRPDDWDDIWENTDNTCATWQVTRDVFEAGCIPGRKMANRIMLMLYHASAGVSLNRLKWIFNSLKLSIRRQPGREGRGENDHPFR